MKNDRIPPFRIDVAPEVLSDLRQRLKNTRWSYQVEGTHSIAAGIQASRFFYRGRLLLATMQGANKGALIKELHVQVDDALDRLEPALDSVKSR